MASYGAATYGVDQWGGAYELGAARLLYMIRMAPNWRALADLIDNRWATLVGIAEQIRTVFNLDTAAGEQLDLIGQWLGLERLGMTNDRYRRALRVQVTILSSSSGSSQSLIDVFTRWIGAAPHSYRNVPPAYAELSGTIGATDENLLRQFLLKAAPAGVVLSVGASFDASFLLADSVADPIADPGTVDCVADPILDAATLVFEIM